VRLPLRTATAAALAGAVVLCVPAAAHAPRDARPGAPRMDLEVLVPPPISGRITPGAIDAAVSVDGFGNRFALARKEAPQRAVGLDPRGRLPVRSGYWQWTSSDAGTSWENVETLPRGADALLPEGSAHDVASSGSTTWFAAATPAGVVVTRLTATGRGKVEAGDPSVYASARGLASGLALAPFQDGAFLVVGDTIGTSVVSVGAAEAGAVVGNDLPGSRCRAAAAGRAGKVRLLVACVEGDQVVLHTSLDGARTFSRRVVGPLDRRGGGTGAPSVDQAADGTAYVLSGTTLWRTTPSGRTTTQDVASEGGDHRVTDLAVSPAGRVGVAAYRRLPGATWNIVVTLFTAGSKPVWSDFAYHDPVSPQGSSAPASGRVSIDMDERGRIQVVWTATHLHSAELSTPLLRNVWAARSVTT
jgi:hypothetical protein